LPILLLLDVKSVPHSPDIPVILHPESDALSSASSSTETKSPALRHMNIPWKFHDYWTIGCCCN
ncbi:hypothetical protein L9F63_013587, partial [Diploptera punctata]